MIDQTEPTVIKVGNLYWRDYGRDGGWPWTERADLAARFTSEVANKIVSYWTAHHHAAVFNPDGSILTPATSLGGVLPLNATLKTKP